MPETLESAGCFLGKGARKQDILPSQLSTTTIEPRKKPSYFPLYWLVNRDPYNDLL